MAAGKTAEALAEHFGVDPQKAYIAGISHDIAREFSRKKMRRLAEKSYEVEQWELVKPALLHGKAGAVILRERFGITDREFLEAVRFHTTGMPGMSDLAKIVYIADYIEPNRKHDGKTILNTNDGGSLEHAFHTILETKYRYLSSIKKHPAPPTKLLMEEMLYKRCDE